jgi:hypothetical protein
VGAFGYSLARAERGLGQQSWSVGLASNSYELPNDEYLWRAGASPVRRELQRWGLLLRALLRFDVIHFNFGRTLTDPRYFPAPGERLGWKRRLRNWVNGLLDLKDLPLLKRAGKTIVMTFQGDDARQGEVFQRLSAVDLREALSPGYYSPESDAYKRWRIRQVARYADRIYALNPDLLRVLPPTARFLAYPTANPWDYPVCPPAPGDPPVILHAPTHRGIKGTQFILDVVRRLKEEGVRFQFRLVEGLKRREALALYPQADLLVDQLLVGWYGGLAIELMALGKPVLCYIRPEDLEFIPRAMRDELPILCATPLNLYEVLKDWLTRRKHELRALGERSRAFVERWHDPRKIAAGLIQDYRAARARGQARAGSPDEGEKGGRTAA